MLKEEYYLFWIISEIAEHTNQFEENDMKILIDVNGLFNHQRRRT